MGRFDYVKYDETANLIQAHFKEVVENLEKAIDGLGSNALSRAAATPVDEKQRASLLRSRATALTKLEEFYMWIGKAVRDEQIMRDRNTVLQEGRKNG